MTNDHEKIYFMNATKSVKLKKIFLKLIIERIDDYMLAIKRIREQIYLAS